jgi:hypothetical protein
MVARADCFACVQEKSAFPIADGLGPLRHHSLSLPKDSLSRSKDNCGEAREKREVAIVEGD